jgi:hypothetical protein
MFTKVQGRLKKTPNFPGDQKLSLGLLKAKPTVSLSRI